MHAHIPYIVTSQDNCLVFGFSGVSNQLSTFAISMLYDYSEKHL